MREFSISNGKTDGQVITLLHLEIGREMFFTTVQGRRYYCFKCVKNMGHSCIAISLVVDNKLGILADLELRIGTNKILD